MLAGGDSSHERDIVFSRNSWVKTIPTGSSYYEMYSNPKLKDAHFRNNEIWVSCGAEYRDILRKTVLALKLIEPNLENYDFIVRTNVSSYFDHLKIEKVLQSHQTLEYFYGGYIEEYKPTGGGQIPFVSGAAVFMNAKVAKIVSEMNPDEYQDYPDDVAFSILMKKHKVKTTFLSRGNICSHGFFTTAPHYRLKSSLYSELAGLRIQAYHNFTLEHKFFKKFQIALMHQRLELSYIRKGDSKSYLARCWQALKIAIKYRYVNCLLN